MSVSVYEGALSSRSGVSNPQPDRLCIPRPHLLIIQGVSREIVNILGGGSMDYYE